MDKITGRYSWGVAISDDGRDERVESGNGSQRRARSLQTYSAYLMKAGTKLSLHDFSSASLACCGLCAKNANSNGIEQLFSYLSTVPKKDFRLVLVRLFEDHFPKPNFSENIAGNVIARTSKAAYFSGFPQAFACNGICDYEVETTTTGVFIL